MDMDLIYRRREEITQEIHRLQKRIAEMEKELVDLDTTERVFNSLTGASGPPPRPSVEREPETEPRAKPENLPTMPELIRQALGSLADPEGARPKEVRDWIAANRWPDVPRDSVASIIWRMLKRGEVVKDGSRYKLPEPKEAADENLGGQPSAASLFQPQAQDREGGSGGGT